MQITKQARSDLIYHHLPVEIASIVALTIFIGEDKDER